MKFQPKRLTGYSEADIIQEIRRVVLEECGGVIPSREQFARVARLHPKTVVVKFGTYEEAFRRAGFAYTEKYTAEQVKANLCEVLKRADGYCFSQDFYQKNGGAYSVKTVKSILGLSWEDALLAIGAKKRVRVVHVPVSPRSQWLRTLANMTEDDLFKEIERVWQAKGCRPIWDEFRRLSPLGTTTIYQRRFGSWARAVESFCKAKGVPFQGKGGTRVSKEILLDELRRVSALVPNVSLTYRTYKANGGTYSRKPFESHFGSWTKAVNAAGCKSGRQIKYSNDELFDETQRLWEQLGRQPTSAEMNQRGRFSSMAYHDRFGGWTKAIHAFCADRNSDSTPTPPSPTVEQSVVSQVPSEPDKKDLPVVIPSAESSPLVIIHKTARSVPKRLRWRVFARDNFTCKGCGRSPTKHGVVLEADHILAWDNGGETMFENLQTLCEGCNNGKSNL